MQTFRQISQFGGRAGALGWVSVGFAAGIFFWNVVSGSPGISLLSATALETSSTGQDMVKQPGRIAAAAPNCVSLVVDRGTQLTRAVPCPEHVHARQDSPGASREDLAVSSAPARND